jgi:hypothetical protein
LRTSMCRWTSFLLLFVDTQFYIPFSNLPSSQKRVPENRYVDLKSHLTSSISCFCFFFS